MPKIYKTNFRGNTDIFPECLINGAIAKEIWFFPDTTVLVLLSKIFIDKNLTSEKYDKTIFEFIKELSSFNMNVMPLAIIEATRVDRDLECSSVNMELMQKICLALLRAQCIDLGSFDSNNILDWKLSEKRIQFIIESYVGFESKNLDELAIEMAVFFSAPHAFEYLKAAKNLERKVIKPMLELTRLAYIHGNSSLSKIKLFKEGIKEISPYCPKIIDFCLQALLFSEKQDSLVRGAIKKFKTEIDHCAIDIALCEIASQSNVWKIFQP